MSLPRRRWTARRRAGRMLGEGGLTLLASGRGIGMPGPVLAGGFALSTTAILCFLAFAPLAIPGPLRGAALGGLSAGYLLAILGGVAALVRWRKAEASGRLYAPQARVRLTPDGVCIAYQDAARAYRWRAFAAFGETRSVFLLRRHDGRVVVVPKPDDGVDALREALINGFLGAFREAGGKNEIKTPAVPLRETGRARFAA